MFSLVNAMARRDVQEDVMTWPNSDDSDDSYEDDSALDEDGEELEDFSWPEDGKGSSTSSMDSNFSVRKPPVQLTGSKGKMLFQRIQPKEVLNGIHKLPVDDWM